MDFIFNDNENFSIELKAQSWRSAIAEHMGLTSAEGQALVELARSCASNPHPAFRWAGLLLLLRRRSQ